VALSASAGALCLQNVPGRLEICALDSLERTDQFTFLNQIAMADFVEGKRLFVLASDQTGYLLQPASSEHSAANAPSSNSPK
jgi:hypothetical protein